MRLILLVLILFTLVSPIAHAQSDKVAIAPCLPANAALIRLEGFDEFSGSWTQVVKDIPAFYALGGTPIAWLGYAPKGQEYKEWQGIGYGFGGVDMRLYGEQFYIYLYSDGRTFKDRRVIGRIEVHGYGLSQYVLYFTRLYANADSNGEHMGYHIFAVNGMACMFFVNADDFREGIGWE